MEKGELVLDYTYGPTEPKFSPRMEALANLYKECPANTGVKVVEQSSNRFVADFDWTAMEIAMGRPAPEPAAVPVRHILDQSTNGGQVFLRVREFYTGGDSAVAERMRERNKGTAFQLPTEAH